MPCNKGEGVQRAKSTLTNHFNAVSFLFGEEHVRPFFHVGDMTGQFFCTLSDLERKKRPRSARAKGPTCSRGLPRRSRTESQHCKAQGVLEWVSFDDQRSWFGSLLGQVFQNESPGKVSNFYSNTYTDHANYKFSASMS